MGKIVYKVKEKYWYAANKAREWRDTNAPSDILINVELLEGQTLRCGKIITLTSATHHQRHSPCFIYVKCDDAGIPYRVTVTSTLHNYLPRRDIMPFDAFLDLGGHIASEEVRKDAAMYSVGLEVLYELFTDWVEKNGLGFTPLGEDRLFLPMFIDMQQYEAFKLLHLEEYFTRPYKIFETVIAVANDRDWLHDVDPRVGKGTYTQFCIKNGFEMPRKAQGPERLDVLCRAYNKWASR